MAKADRINWRGVWREFDTWADRAEVERRCSVDWWPEQKRAIQRIVEKQMRDKGKEPEAEEGG